VQVVHKANGGLSSARNAGLDVATGEYVMFVDSDDKIDAEMLMILYDEIASNNADVVITLSKILGQNEIDSIYYRHKVQFTGAEAMIALFQEKLRMCVWAKLFKKRVISGIRFREGVLNEDIEYMFYVYQNCSKVLYLPVAFYNYRTNPTSITKVKLSSLFRDCLNNVDVIEEKAKLLSPEICKAAHTLKVIRYIHIAMLIRRRNALDYYADELSRCLYVIRKNAFEIFFSSSISFKYKIKAIAALLKINIPGKL
jgi:glycosyltransferase involved in cell wall biosynthesis